MSDDRLYELLPAIYRQRDHELGEPLRALLAVIQEEVNRLEADLEGLYDNWFVETADEWLLPYIGDLLGVTNLHTVQGTDVYSLRAYIANTLTYRQRKGTAAVLEQLANDITNWEARVVEFFQLLSTTQHLNHVRLHNTRTPDLRLTNRLELLDSPFDRIAHTGEVRRTATRQGRYNIPNVGLFLWRLQAYPLQRTTPRAVVEPADGRYMFNPLGLDTLIFNRPQAEPGINHIATERNVPVPIRLRALYESRKAYLGGVEPVLQIWFDGMALTDDEIAVCHLGEWDAVGWTPPVIAGVRAVVDPVFGRLALLEAAPVLLEVSHTYGFSADVGGGPYDRNETLNGDLLQRDWVVQVAQNGSADFATLAAAIADWNTQPAGTRGVIAIVDNHTYSENLTGANAIQIPAHSDLLIAGTQPFTPGIDTQLDATASRPHLRGNLSVQGSAAPGDENPGALCIDGLLIEGTVQALTGNLGRFTLQHCTVTPGAAKLTAPSATNNRLHVTLLRTICGGVALGPNVPFLTIEESIVDAGDNADIIARGAETAIRHSTIIGANDDPAADPALHILHASETIFTGRLIVARRQVGCARFCHVPLASRTPRRYRCQPDAALEGIPDAQQLAASVRLRPQFTSVRYGDPGYMQLAATAAIELRTGAVDGSEMGVFSFLQQPQREANLRTALDEYLPFGLQAGLFYVT